MVESGLLWAKLSCIFAMLIFGTIGIFVRYLSLPSAVIALARAIIGMVFLFLIVLIKKRKINTKAIKRNFWLLFLSGTFIGFNWILLFEAYRYTTVAVATLCYYMAPVFVILVSPIVQQEKLTQKKLMCTLAAFLGMVCISGVEGMDLGSFLNLGIAYGLAAAVLYATVVLLNKKIRGVSAYERTLSQIGIAGVVLLPYTILTEDIRSLILGDAATIFGNVGSETLSLSFGTRQVLLLLIVGVVHTAVAYALYFSAMEKLPVQTTAIYSYIDPVTAVVLSVVLLKEKLGILGIIGMVLILGATFLEEK